MVRSKTATMRSASAVALTAALGALAITPTALAQTVDGADGDGVRDVITVTAQRREENLQDVPVAVTALSAANLEARQIRDVNDLQTQIPNAVVSTGTGTASSARIFFRGVGEDESRGAVDPAVGIYVDGVYLGRTVGSLVDLVDTQQIEVLRGPQGTLYGRNTNGGAVKITSVQPQMDDLSLDQDFTVGSDQRFSTRTTINLPLGDSTAFRVSGLYKYRDGFFTLTPNGALEGLGNDNLGMEQVFAIRGSLLHEFSDTWSATVIVDYTDDNTDPTPASIIAESDDPSVVTDVDGNIFTVEPQPGVECTATQVFQSETGCFIGFDSAVEAFGASLKLEGELGDFTVTSTTAYRTLDDELATIIGGAFSQETDQEQFSEEITLASNFDGPFNFVSGLFYYSEDVQLDSVFFFPFSLNVDTQSFAIFGQGVYDITDRLSLTAGARFTTENRDFTGDTGAPGITVPLPLQETLETDNVTYTVSLDYSITDDFMVYGSYSTGFKAPGFSPDCFNDAVCFRAVEEEKLDSFEAGFRSEWLDGAFVLNGTYFYNTYDDLQLSATLPTGGFTRSNAANARIQGIELESTWSPVEGLEIYANGSWLDAEYRDLTAFQAGVLTNSNFADGVAGPACGNVTADPVADQAGFQNQIVDCALALELKGAPTFKATVGFIHTQPFAGGLLSFGGDLAYEDDAFALVQNNPGSLSQPGVRINARASFRPEDSRWRISVWGKNLTDREYFQAASNPNDVYASPPLTWGVDLGVSF